MFSALVMKSLSISVPFNRFRRKDKHFLSYILRFPVKDEKTDEKTSQMFECLGKYAYLRSVRQI